MLEWAKTIFAYFCQRLDQSGVGVPELTYPLAPPMGQTERAARFDVLLPHDGPLSVSLTAASSPKRRAKGATAPESILPPAERTDQHSKIFEGCHLFSAAASDWYPSGNWSSYSTPECCQSPPASQTPILPGGSNADRSAPLQRSFPPGNRPDSWNRSHG